MTPNRIEFSTEWPPAHWKNFTHDEAYSYRGNSEMNAGDEEKMREIFSPEGLERAEYWMFSACCEDQESDGYYIYYAEEHGEEAAKALMEANVSIGKVCRALDGQIFAKNDMKARQHLPPLHDSCRSTIIEIDDKQEAERAEIARRVEARERKAVK